MKARRQSAGEIDWKKVHERLARARTATEEALRLSPERAREVMEERAEFGVLADTVYEVMTVRTEEVFEPPGSVAGVGREYLRGVTKEALIVLDGSVLLQAIRFFIDQSDELGT